MASSCIDRARHRTPGRTLAPRFPLYRNRQRRRGWGGGGLGAADRPDEPGRLDACGRRAGRSRREQDRGRLPGRHPLAAAADLGLPSLEADAGKPAEHAGLVSLLVRPEFREVGSRRPTPPTGTARSSRNTACWSASAPISAASRCSIRRQARPRRCRTGPAAISVPATGPNTIPRAASFAACRRRTICRCRPTLPRRHHDPDRRKSHQLRAWNLDYPPALIRPQGPNECDQASDRCGRALSPPLAHNRGMVIDGRSIGVATAGFCAFINLYSSQACCRNSRLNSASARAKFAG